MKAGSEKGKDEDVKDVNAKVDEQKEGSVLENMSKRIKATKEIVKENKENAQEALNQVVDAASNVTTPAATAYIAEQASNGIEGASKALEEVEKVQGLLDNVLSAYAKYNEGKLGLEDFVKVCKSTRDCFYALCGLFDKVKAVAQAGADAIYLHGEYQPTSDEENEPSLSEFNFEAEKRSLALFNLTKDLSIKASADNQNTAATQKKEKWTLI